MGSNPTLSATRGGCLAQGEQPQTCWPAHPSDKACPEPVEGPALSLACGELVEPSAPALSKACGELVEPSKGLS